MTRQSLFTGSVVLLIVVFLFSFFSDDLGKRDGSASEALKALDVWTLSRAYPGPDIPAEDYFKAFLDAKNLMNETEALSSVPAPWVSIGPTNFAGKTIAVALNPLNPNTIYIGAACGGLWRSRTGGLGADWQRVAIGFPVLGVNAIAIHPADTNTLYIGTGEVYRYNGSTGGIVIRATRGSYGMGILKTT